MCVCVCVCVCVRARLILQVSMGSSLLIANVNLLSKN